MIVLDTIDELEKYLTRFMQQEEKKTELCRRRHQHVKSETYENNKILTVYRNRNCI